MYEMTTGTGFGVHWLSRAHCLLMNSMTENEVHRRGAVLGLSQRQRLERKRETPMGQISALHGRRIAQWLFCDRAADHTGRHGERQF